MQTAVEELAQALGSQCCNATLRDPAGQTAIVRYEHRTPACSYRWCALQTTIHPDLSPQLASGQTVHCCAAHPNQAEQRVSILVHPIFDDQEILGELWLMAPSYHCFHQQDIRLVQQVANQCAIALRQSRLYRTAQVQVQELERLNDLKDDFLSTISHELRTPMSSIKLALQMLDIHLRSSQLAEPDAVVINRYLQVLHTESQQEINLINDLLDLTRLKSGTEPLNLSPIYLQFWLPHVAEPFIERTRNQDLQLQVQVPEDLPPLTSDLPYLERVLTELLHNACKYTPAGEAIVVSAYATDPDIILEVSNSGVEIAPEERQRIFDKFYRIPNHDPWKHGGTGLGLALVQRFVTYLGGQITVTSAQQQTTFTVRLPQKPEN
jgi:signal transduction histidine kinase